MTQIPVSGTIAQFQAQVAAYLPTLAAGLVVLALGIVVGWVAKRAVMRALLWLRLDRLGGGHSWRAAFAKGDVRSALYSLAGNVVMIMIVLVFLDNALQIWGLVVLSRLVDQVLFYLPTVGMVALIGGIGVLLANTLAERVEDTLEEEGIGRARLVSRIFKSALLAVVGALALWELNFGRQIVLAAFLIGFGAIGVSFALAVGLGSSRAIQRAWDLMIDRKRED